MRDDYNTCADVRQVPVVYLSFPGACPQYVTLSGMSIARSAALWYNNYRAHKSQTGIISSLEGSH
jgi:hypothetical protein